MNIELIATYLDDTAVANAARTSFNDEAKNYTPEQNESLIKYLARGVSSKEWDLELSKISAGTGSRYDADTIAFKLASISRHWAPFAHPQATFKVIAPIPVARQLFKHKVGTVESEVSRRYISSEPTLYVPQEFREKSKTAKQGSGGKHSASDQIKEDYIRVATASIDMYNDMINKGVCPEQARLVLPQGMEVQWIWTVSLASAARIYNQRTDPHAQKETAELIGSMGDLMSDKFPLSWRYLTTSGEYDE